ncbi:MAG TPA: phage tail protein [Actinomycetota bacterium]|nr:phage tail protein [Actinomycetota bacterium]
MPSLFKPLKPFLQTNAWQHQNLNSLQYNTSIAGSVIPIIYGKTRQSINLIGFGNFSGPQGKKGKVTQLPITGTTQNAKGGKGGGGSKKGATGKKSQDFSIDVSFGICQGPANIEPNNFVWASAGVAFFQSVGLNLYTGADGQAPDPVMVGLGQVVGYSGTLYVTGTPMDLGSSPVLPNLSFEVTGFLSGTGGTQFAFDADPAQVVVDFLSNARYGAAFPAANIAADIDTVYGDYCIAAQLPISVSLNVQNMAHEWLAGLAKNTNSAIVWSGKILKIIPYGDLPLAAGNVSWTPNVTPEYDLDDDDYLPWSPHLDVDAPQEGQEDPVLITRSNPADAVNWLTIEYLDRNNFYNATVIAVFDQLSIDLYGMRSGENLQGHMFCNAASAQISAQLWLQRLLYIRNTYKWQLGWQFALLEPMDIVLLTDSRSGLSKQAVRITSIEENENGDLTFEGEELAIGAGFVPPTTPLLIESTHTAGVFFDASSGEGLNPSEGVAWHFDPLTTVHLNDYIYVAVGCAGPAGGATPIVASITSTTGLIFTKVTGEGFTNVPDNQWQNLELWRAFSAGTLTNEHLTISLSDVAARVIWGAFAINGANPSTPQDPDLSLPAHNSTNAGTGPTVTISTSHDQDAIIWAAIGQGIFSGNLGCPPNLAAIPGHLYPIVPSPFYAVHPPVSANLCMSIFVKITPNAQTALTLTALQPNSGVCIATATQGS